MSLITVRGIQKLVGKGNVFLYKHSHFPSFAPVGKSLLKVLLYISICMYYIYTFTHRYAYLFVNQYMQMQYCSQHCAGRGFASSLCMNSNASSIYCASLVLGTEVLWVCPDLTLPLSRGLPWQTALNVLFHVRAHLYPWIDGINSLLVQTHLVFSLRGLFCR